MADLRRIKMLSQDRARNAEGLVRVEADTRPITGYSAEARWVLTYADGRQLVGVLSRFIPAHMRVDGWTPEGAS